MHHQGGIPHLSGVGSDARQVLAAHYLRNCEHVVEIGGHERPITSFLTHHPRSVTSVDPKTPTLEASTLNGKPCRVRHLARKFQQVEFDFVPQSYGLVLLGYSLKPFGTRDPLGDVLFSLIDNAKMVIVDYTPGLDRAVSQVPTILERPVLRTLCMLELRLFDPEIADTPFAERRFHVLESIHVSN